ncbi:primosomal protein N' [Arthrobacter caoxuetaonis]|uniref:Probable replication restart protein PriA n=1 Tax=Arthrobacter caoxuetaonis TaxID=2886935 RepID=A0A9X1MEH9_9MICC|nr:primosomal protein N' [Arthrobacter caoxuetaonis]MCC3297872.1 primosomal protein N' [Arthrobacter caoxuetaonis]USQ55942.1 primosomal protein N' [Arthrobacter caoxuetaonis]
MGERAGHGTPESEAVQLSLLHGFAQPAAPVGKAQTAPALPIARVLLDSPLPHLDRPFDYLVPAELDGDARLGVRVKVRFGGQELPGFLTARLESTETTARLVYLGKVVSPVPVLSPEILSLAEAVAARYAGSVHDVLRVAVPPRVARVEKEFAGRTVDGALKTDLPGSGPATSADTPGSESGAETGSVPETTSPFRLYPHGPRFLGHLAAGHSPRAVLASLRGYGPDAWPEEIAAAVEATVLSGRGAVVVVPDQKDLARVMAALQARVPEGTAVRLTGEDGPTPRYRSFLQLLYGDASVAVGTRSAAYAPVANLGLVCIWDDADGLHAEQRAPYQHARDVLLLRAEAAGAGMLVASHARSTEAQRLVESGWAAALGAERPLVRKSTPRVVSTADSFSMERDPLAARARIPHAAWKAAQDGLKRGPVLVQVARTGFSPALSCQDCREPARCRQCQGPLAQAGRNALPACRWCARPEPRWHCPSCGSFRLRASTAGAGRTAEELGRAFPSVPVISSAGDHIRTDVPDAPALVVATPGAEPVAPSGYAAGLLLDGTAMLSRQSLHAQEETLRRWLTAAALVRPAGDGGVVVVTADDSATVGHLLRWDPAGAAERELGLRRELGLPPAVRFAELTGSREGLEGFISRLEVPDTARIVGPAPVEDTASYRSEEQGNLNGAVRWRTLCFFPYADAAALTAAMRAAKAALSARRTGDPVYIRVDGQDIL